MLYAAGTFALTWSAGPFSGSKLPDGGELDQGAGLWGTEWIAHALAHGLNLFHTNLLGYPGGVNLGSTPLAVTLGAIVAPITLTLGPVVAENALEFISFVLSALSMYAVLRLWCRRWTPAFLGGLFFGFCPFMITQGYPGGHGLFLFGPILPWLCWCAYELCVTQRRSRWKLGLGLGVLATLQGYTSLEILSDLVIVIGLVVAAVVVRHPRVARRKARYALSVLGSALVVFAPLIGVQLWWTVFAADHIVGPTQPVAAFQGNRVDLFGPIVPLSHQLLAPAHLAAIAAGWVGGDLTENDAYLGITFVVLVVALAVVARRDLVVRTAAALAAVAFILSLGNRLEVGGRTTSIPLPEAVIPHISLLDNTLPARFSLLVALFLAFVVGIGIDRSWDRAHDAGWSPRRTMAIGGVAVALAAVPIIPDAPLPSAPLVWPTSALTVFRAIPAGSVVLAYPYPAPYWPEAEEWSAMTGLSTKLVGGYLNFREPDGSSSIEMPLLLRPPYVEEYFTEHEFGRPYFPYAPPPDATARADLCTFVLNYQIGAIVTWSAGENPAEITSYVSSVFGTPTITDGTVLAWIDPSQHCRS